ncbi:cytokine-induced anti-apoptosis inhibitor 1, Fe-S biogenesis-domain-containing protein [Ochromonadaceae sp. CCMP2298]|nr:cytokine-induced anti-apoptosis inhibitor 1, Fe-S biogenesis-domain-containing protein [Ochromonadaceae sp. CCMP2298]|mmetsp:Transcript_19986/g.44464  ORF Transcript_19986/g.44464 Transcript_19986/m.44464 type:complete len:259 (+) Transcript_19986:94-870(+)
MSSSSSRKKVLLVHASSDQPSPVDASSVDYTFVAASACPTALDTLTQDTFHEVKMTGAIPDDDTQAKLLELLIPLGKMSVDGVADRETGQALALDLKIQGFMDIMAAMEPSSGDRFVVCQKPGWEVGAAASVVIQPSAAADAKKWKMDTGDLADGDLIDESQLLDKDFTVPVPAACGAPGPGGKKRACKDCSCGLADGADAAELNASSTMEEKVVRSSACGSCNKGDAFRCASCPFLGKPAFEAGAERVVLSMGADDF